MTDERMKRFILTAEDAKYTTVRYPDYSQCEGCALNDVPADDDLKCAAYPHRKAGSVLYDKKPCEHRIPE